MDELLKQALLYDFTVEYLQISRKSLRSMVYIGRFIAWRDCRGFAESADREYMI